MTSKSRTAAAVRSHARPCPFRLAAALGVCFTLAVGFSAGAADILRGGGVVGSRGSPSFGPNPVPTAQARSNAKDTLARTTQAVQAVQAMQAAARAAALSGPHNLGADPNHPGLQLPNVPNGLAPGGLQIAPGVPVNLANPQPGENAKLWQGATLPSQSTANGRTTVLVQQKAQQALLTWQTFNIGKETTLRFDQSAGGANASQWIAFNKINDPSGSPSQILGAMKADGQVYVINQNGIIFGGSSQINLHALTASSLPINDNLIARGLLNNPDAQFLFSSLPISAGSQGTPAFTPVPALTPSGLSGDVVVQKGATLTSPTTPDHVGGRIALVGPNVRNAGTIATPDGQTILAAGQQVGFAAHPGSDPSLRGLDAYVGAVADPALANPPPAGTATNAGLIDAPHASVVMTGRTVEQLGVIDSSTSVSLNGRIDLLADYDAAGNLESNSTNSSSNGGVRNLSPFLFLPRSAGTVTLGAGSVTRILPDLSTTDIVVGTALPLLSQINLQGQAVHLAANSTVLAPNAGVALSAGLWSYLPGNSGQTRFIYSGGQIYLDAGATINVAGSTDVSAPLTENILSVQLRGAELADSPLQRTGPVRGVALSIDVRKTGMYNGLAWTGTPLGNAAGFAGLVQRTAAELTSAGGTVKLTAGSSVVVQRGAKIDVSGGWTNYDGGLVQTTRLLADGRLWDIAQATPDRVYTGIYTGTFARNFAKYGVTETFSHPLDLLGAHYEPGYLQGANGGTVAISAPAMALDGELLGLTISGPRQRASTPLASTLSLAFQAQNATSPFLPYAPTPPGIVFDRAARLIAADPFALDLAGQPLPLRAERRAKIFLSPELMGADGFGNLVIDNSDGSITVPAQVALTAPAGGSIKLKGANIDIQGRVAAPGGTVSFDVFNLSQTARNALVNVQIVPSPDPTRGTFTLGSAATLSAAGLVVDDRADSPTRLFLPLMTVDGKSSIDGGAITIRSYSADLATGSVIDVSGGVALNVSGKRTYGKGGSISISAGQDLNVNAVLGGRLTLGATLRGFSGGTGGALSILAPQIQIGGVTGSADVLLLQPDFFSQGGFGSFTLTGLGAAGAKAGEYLPAVVIAPGTVIAPVAQSSLAVTNATDVTLTPALLPAGVRPPVSLTFAAPGVTGDPFDSNLLLTRGDFVMGAGAIIRTDPRASVTISGNSAAVLGSIIAPGGVLTIRGNNLGVILQLNTTGAAQPNVDLGPHSFLSTAGATVLTPDPRGHRTGLVLDGGTITISGNIVAEAGAVLDVSGARDVFELSPAYGGAVGGDGLPLDYANGGKLARSVSASLTGSRVVPMVVESNGGTISLLGSQELFTDATLLGRAGGKTALGGNLIIGSGIFVPVSGIAATPLDTTLRVTQSGRTIPAAFYAPGQTAIRNPVRDGNGTALAGLGYFSADRFIEGGFDALTLKGTVQFAGPVTINARRSLSIADGGVIFGDSAVRLSAPYVRLGKDFQTPIGPLQTNPPFPGGFAVPPVFGPGSLTVTARLIDIGNLSLRGLGAANFSADGGEIRGDGTLAVAGAITLRAAQIYPPTGVTFSISASDYVLDGAPHGGSVTIIGSGTRAVPLSAGGQLNVYGSTITQAGTLRAPLGGIALGWDGTGTAPVDAITLAPVAATQQLTLAPGSVTSVAGLDSATGRALLIPYGLNLNGTSWIDPAGTDITAGGLPVKSVILGGANVAVQSGAQIDIRGGGDLFAYRWVTGKGGTRDILASATSFAVIPGYAENYAPFAPFNTSSPTGNLGSDPGYVNGALAVGDRVHLGASAGLAAGDYTLLPARYALLPGAFLVTPQTGLPLGTQLLPEGATYVSGYRFNDLNGARIVRPLSARFEVASATTVRARAQYDDSTANSFLTESAAALGIAVPRLAVDAGRLVFSATQGMTLQGSVLARGAAGGRGGLVDVSSPLDILIAGPGAAAVPGSIVLDAAALSGYGADSLLIGGIRQTGTSTTTIIVKTGNLTVSNAGSPLTAPDVILVASKTLTLSPGAEVAQKGTVFGTDTALVLGDATVAGSGDGLLLRVSGDPAASITRRGITSSTVPVMTIGAHARIAGAGMILDSTYGTSLDPTATLIGDAITLNSGQISLEFDAPGVVPQIAGLMLAGPALQGLQTAQALSLTSYSSIDLFGHGTFSTTGKFALHAAEIRGFNTGGTVNFTAPEIILDNAANGTALGAAAAPDGTLALNATTIRLGAGALRVDQFAFLEMNATGGLITEGAGGLATQGALTITAPIITGAKAANQAITAGGALVIKAPAAGAATITGGLGASLSLTGTSIADNSLIRLPSGTLTLRATAGDVTVGDIAASGLDVGGTAQTFYDLTKYTDGGQINVISDTGSVNLGMFSVVKMAAQNDGGNAGSLAIRAQAGTFMLDGALFGQGGTGGRSGAFTLDVGTLPSAAPANAILDAAKFNQSRSIRVRSGDVAIDGLATARTFNLSADQGSITVTGAGRIDAHGATGGAINLTASGSVTLDSGAELTVAATEFSSAGKGGAVSLEAGAERNGTASATGFVDIQTGSTIDLSVASVIGGTDAETAAKTAAAQLLGKFTGTLHLRAPQTAGNTDMQVKPINGAILNASSIVAEGYQIFDLTRTGGLITGTGAATQPAGGIVLSSAVNVQGSIKANGTLFAGNTAAMTAALLANNAALAPVLSVVPGAEVINTASGVALPFTLGTSGASSLVLPGTGGSVLFPSGTPGNDRITSTLAGTITSATGVVTTLGANTATAIAAGSTVTLTGAGTVAFASGGSGGPIPVTLQPGTSFTTSATGTSGTVSGLGNAVTLNTSGTSAMALAVGSSVLFPGGTPGNDRISATVAGTITSASGVVTVLAANTNTAIAAGSTVKLNSAGTVKFSTGTGGAIPVTLLAGSFTTVGATGITPATGNLTLGTLTSTATSDWQLQTSRFGPKSVPGVLTLRAGGNLVFFNAISDGFDSSAYNAELLAPNPLLPANAQSYAYRMVSGADFTAADFHQVRPLAGLSANLGSVLLGKNYGTNVFSTGVNATTSTAVATRFQVIRTGSGEIDVAAGRDVKLLNQFATIYTAGTRLANPTVLPGGTFDLPILDASGGTSSLGAIQQNPGYAAQFSLAGGNVTIAAQIDLTHQTQNTTGALVSDSSKELPNNWLYRRGFVDPATGQFGVSNNGEFASTSWWVDFSNFFEGVGALGGGNVTLVAGRDVTNFDGLVPTNARMPQGTPDASQLVELGGGDLIVHAGRNIDGGVYYIERGQGSLTAGNEIKTNLTRSPSLQNFVTPNQYLSEQNWLPTTLFLGKGSYHVAAAGNLLLGPVANPFLLPGGYNNTFWYKTYFSTYAADDAVNVASLGGSVTLRASAGLTQANSAPTPLLSNWLSKMSLLSINNPSSSVANFQPWLRLDESNIPAHFATLSTIMPATLRATAFSGDINLIGGITLSPSPKGTVDLAAAGAINGLQKNGASTVAGVTTANWGSSRINLSDADPANIPGLATPLAYQVVIGTSTLARVTGATFFDSLDNLFAETGSTTGSAAVLQTKLALHDSGLLHLGDTNPVRLYASAGDISGLTLFSGKAARVLAGRDITDVAIYVQNVDVDDVTIVAATRDIIAYNANSQLRSAAQAPGNQLNPKEVALAGDIQISGPGTLEVLAGRDLDLGTGASNTDGTGVGITSIGNARNPSLPFEGAGLVVGAGIGLANGLAGSSLDFETFLSKYLNTPAGDKYLAELAATNPALKDLAGATALDALPEEQRAIIALQIFYLALRDAGRSQTAAATTPAAGGATTVTPGGYAAGYAAIKALFGSSVGQGDIKNRARDIRTRSGGNISIFAPGGKLTLASSTIGNPLAPPGIVTEAGGNVNVFTDGSVDLGIARIFTLRGGNIIIWSSKGDIAAGSSAKTVASAPPTRVVIDPQTADVKTDLAGLATGGGIGVLATVMGVAPGDVDLIAPSGVVDAGDAGIRVSGNLNIAATAVLNASNIAAGGTVAGAPAAPVVAAPSLSAVAPQSTASQAGDVAKGQQQEERRRAQEQQEELPSIITVEVIGYGGEL